jgi:VWFA-related protein
MLTVPKLALVFLGAGVLVPNQETTITLDVNLVVINVTVYDSDGKVVPGLGKDAFQIFEDDVERPISLFKGEDAPVTAGLLVDNSASMRFKRAEVTGAALAFARSSNPADQIFVIHFNERPKFGLPALKPFTDSIPELETALSRYESTGSTALYDGIGMALSHFQRATLQRKVLIAISDGGDNSSQATLSNMLRWARDSGVVFYCIGLLDELDRDRNPEALEEFASATGGSAYFPATLTEATGVCVRIAREIRSQYTLGFAGAEDGKYHRIRVTAQDRQKTVLDVRSRPGYKAMKSNLRKKPQP